MRDADGWHYRPIDDWPGEATPDVERTRAPFTAGWGTTLGLLRKELRMLDAEQVVVQVALEAREFRVTDGHPRSNAKATHPGVVLAFDSKFGPLKYACDTFLSFDDNMRAIGLGLEALRKCDRYGITRRGEQYKGWSQLPSGTVMGARMSRREAARVLVDLAGTGWSGDDIDDAIQMTVENISGQVDDAYRWAVKLHHPDRGGDADLFRRATEARDRLLEVD